MTMIKRLTVTCQEDGDELLKFNAEQAETGARLSDDVVRSAAMELSKGVALKFATERITTLAPVITQGIVNEVTAWIETNVRESDMAPATKELLLNNIQSCSHLAMQEALCLLSAPETAGPQ